MARFPMDCSGDEGFPVDLSNVTENSLIDTLKDKINKSVNVNFSVENISDGSSFTHNLNTEKIQVFFYTTNGRLRNDIDWQPNGVNMISIYLPDPELGSIPFTGDIFIIKR